MAFWWLRHTRRCHIVLFERSPRTLSYERPDVLGVTKARFLIEVEVKRTLADFRANAAKHHIQHRDNYLHRMPKEFWFIVPESICAAVRKELPPFAGLMMFRDDLRPFGREWFMPVVESPLNIDSKRLSLKDAVKLSYLLANQVLSSEMRADEAWAIVKGRQHHTVEDYAI